MNILKKKLVTICVGLILACGALLYFITGFMRSTESLGQKPPDNIPGNVSSQLDSREFGSELSRKDVESKIGRPFTKEEATLKPPDVSWLSWAYAVETHRLSAEENGEFEFFGKVVSKNGQPLSGVSLLAKVSSSETSFLRMLATQKRSKIREIKITTDKDGNFKVSDFGKTLTLTNFHKPGFSIVGEKEFKGMAPRKSWTYSFIANRASSFQSDPKNPEIFTMKKVE